MKMKIKLLLTPYGTISYAGNTPPEHMWPGLAAFEKMKRKMWPWKTVNTKSGHSFRIRRVQ